MATLALICGWIVAVFLGLLGLIVIVLIVTGRIDLKDLLHDEGGKASLARFQYLIFTFVIAAGLLVVTLSRQPPQFPAEIPVGILLLLGLSGASFLTSKAIDAFVRVNSGDRQLSRYEAERRAAEEAEAARALRERPKIPPPSQYPEKLPRDPGAVVIAEQGEPL